MRLLPLAVAAAMSTAAFGSACPALAQAAGNGTNDHAAAAQTTGVQTNANENDDENDHDGWHGHHGWRGDEHGPHGMMMGGRHGWMMQRGAEFRFKRGDARIDVRCPPRQSLNDCVEAAGKLIREIASMHGANPPSPPPGKTGHGTNGLGPDGNNAASMPGKPGASEPGGAQQ
jgi:hypothetical protein